MVSKVAGSQSSVSRRAIPREVEPPEVEGGASYTVRAGDTLGALALKLYGDAGKWTALRDANGLTGDSIRVGATLKLPTAAQVRARSTFDAGKQAKVNLNGGQAVGLDTLDRRADEASAPQLGALGPRSQELLERIDASGNHDGKAQLDELVKFREGLLKQFQDLQAETRRRGVTQADVEKTAALLTDLKTVGTLILSVQAQTQTAQDSAGLAKKIDGLAKDSVTGQRIGNGDGKLSSSELEHFIKDRTQRAATAEKRGDRQLAEEERALVEIGQKLRAAWGK